MNVIGQKYKLPKCVFLVSGRLTVADEIAGRGWRGAKPDFFALTLGLTIRIFKAG